jgi:hypothetical protein
MNGSRMKELVIKVPAPFPGVEDLGFTARYPAQERDTPLRDVPFLVEGPARAMTILVDRLERFPDKGLLIPAAAADEEAYTWSSPVRLTDEICVLAFRDQSLMVMDPLVADLTQVRRYLWNLVRPLAFTFLRDCVRLAELRLADRITVQVDNGELPAIEFTYPRTVISQSNGGRLLYSF